MDTRERAARLELVEFQLGELQRAELKTGEDETLANTRQVLRSADTIQRLCAEGYRDLYEADQSVLATLGGVWKRVSELAALDPRFEPYLRSVTASSRSSKIWRRPCGITRTASTRLPRA